MKQLMEYIEMLHNTYFYDLDNKRILATMEDRIANYISENYEKIEQKQYVFLEYDDRTDRMMMTIDSQFRRELVHYYPERLI